MAPTTDKAGQIVCILSGRIYVFVFMVFCLVLTMHLITMVVYINQNVQTNQIMEEVYMMLKKSETIQVAKSTDVDIENRRKLPFLENMDDLYVAQQNTPEYQGLSDERQELLNRYILNRQLSERAIQMNDQEENSNYSENKSGNENKSVTQSSIIMASLQTDGNNATPPTIYSYNESGKQKKVVILRGTTTRSNRRRNRKKKKKTTTQPSTTQTIDYIDSDDGGDYYYVSSDDLETYVRYNMHPKDILQK